MRIIRNSPKRPPISSTSGCAAAPRRSPPATSPTPSTTGPSKRRTGRRREATCSSTSSTAPKSAPPPPHRRSFSGLIDRPALGWLWPARGDQRQDFGDQPAGLRHDLLVAAGGGAQDEFRDAGSDVIGDARDDRLAVADREVILGFAAGALLVGL